MIREIEHLSHEDRLSELGLFTPEKAQESLIAAYHYLEGVHKKDRGKFFSRAGRGRGLMIQN